MRPLFLMIIKVKVFPKEKEEKIIEKDNQLLIYIKEEAKEGKANKKVFEILSQIYPKRRIICLKGSRSVNKIFKIESL